MRPLKNWKPHMILAYAMGILTGIIGLFMEIGTKRPLFASLEKAGLMALGGGLAGYIAGLTLLALLREVPEPKVPVIFRKSRQPFWEKDAPGREGRGPAPVKEPGPPGPETKDRKEVMTSKPT